MSSLGERDGIEPSAALQTLGYCLFFLLLFYTHYFDEKVGLFACGTIRQKRKFFPANYLAQCKTLLVGQSYFVVSKGVSAYKWKDRGVKYLMVWNQNGRCT